MAYTTIDDPSIYFNTILYTGDGNSTQAISGVGHQPDFVWIKRRDASGNHELTDSVRGINKTLVTNSSNAEDTGTNKLQSFDSDGFTVGNSSTQNASGGTYVSFNWKKTATAGFDIVTYTGNGSARTISHSLSAVPNWMIVFNRDSAMARSVYHHKIASDPATDRIMLNETSAKEDDSGIWNDTVPTSSVFSIGNSSSTNTNTDNYVIYLFSEKKGFSKFGSYTGNGNADGAFVYTGFRPAWIMIKKSSGTEDWSMYDSKRNVNGTTNTLPLLANFNDGESGLTGKNMDILSNGVKMKTSNGELNLSGETYIYMAFAESPFVNSNGVPTNAR
mgnify:CR=1 FL=1